MSKAIRRCSWGDRLDHALAQLKINVTILVGEERRVSENIRQISWNVVFGHHIHRSSSFLGLDVRHQRLRAQSGCRKLVFPEIFRALAA
jgi:hypothetical protein